ncbi:hypothetical protein BU25DRAFT_447962 [Macroventuria anomochaeta]|uniref:Uncharacterized protein n=1 Tax=Macroventuria anomochaeta TaxID=301207 RepID=A0ACB6S2W9_9PLEO|nr:uncharacterized protein BU25DRAFT_447962 [Macroventuria anomochaeta]KAF2628501.1 hypothetical protein BU25DRAFT_447962 [Macroventuria anomochaeta]
MAKRKHVTLASGKASKPTKRHRKVPQLFEQGVNPAPPSLPPTAPRSQRSREPTHQRDCDILSPLFEPPEASQLAVDAHAVDILGEDEDEVLEVNATADDEEQIEPVGEETVGAVSKPPAENSARSSPGVAAAATAAQLSQRQRRQAKADRCTIALQRSRRVAGEGVVVGNWVDFEEELVEMDKESAQVMTCDFDLVLKEELPATQPASQLACGVARQRPGIVTAIQEDGLAAIVAAERSASGVAIGIKDYWRCLEAGCSNNTNNLAVRLIARKITIWSTATLSRSAAGGRSPTSSNSSIEGLTKAILAGHLAQMSANINRCRHESSQSIFTPRPRCKNFNCPRNELVQHTYNFFNYWKHSMPQMRETIKNIVQQVVKEDKYDINMLMDEQVGMTMEVWVNYFCIGPGHLAHLRRKAIDWRKDYGGLTKANWDAMGRVYNDVRESASPVREPLGESEL